MPANQTLTASRNATWGPTLVGRVPGAALTLAGAHAAMQVRLYGGASGDALLTHANVPMTDTDNGDGSRSLTLSPRFEANQIAALPGINSPDAGAAQRFSYDIRLTYADGFSELLVGGDFIVSPGVTTV